MERGKTLVSVVSLLNTRTRSSLQSGLLIFLPLPVSWWVRQGKGNTDFGYGKRDPEKSPFLKGMEEAHSTGYVFASLHSWAVGQAFCLGSPP